MATLPGVLNLRRQVSDFSAATRRRRTGGLTESSGSGWNPVGPDGTGRHYFCHVLAGAFRADDRVVVMGQKKLFKLVVAFLTHKLKNRHCTFLP
jgi:hypothetical protein